MILLILKFLMLVLLEVCWISKVLKLKDTISENMAKKSGSKEDDLVKVIHKDGSIIIKIGKKGRVKYYFIENKFG